MTIIVFLFGLPIIIALILSYSFIINIFTQKITISLFFLFGFLLYFVIYIKGIAHKEINKIYITIHEITHAIFGIFSFNIPRKIIIKKTNGYVEFNKKINPLIAISPYIFPTLNVIIAIIYFLLKTKLKNDYVYIFLFLQGFFIAFHIINTAEVITINQKDFKAIGGKSISLIMITALNLGIVAIFLMLIFSKSNHIIPFLKNTINLYFTILAKIFNFFMYLPNSIFQQ